MDKKLRLLIIDERINLLRSRGSHNNNIIRKLERQKRKLQGQQ